MMIFISLSFPVFITSTLSSAVIPVSISLFCITYVLCVKVSDEKNAVEEGKNQGKNWKRMDAGARRYMLIPIYHH